MNRTKSTKRTNEQSVEDRPAKARRSISKRMVDSEEKNTDVVDFLNRIVECNPSLDEIPYLVAENIPLEVWNAATDMFELYHIRMKIQWYADGSVYILELPTHVHEKALRQIEGSVHLRDPERLVHTGCGNLVCPDGSGVLPDSELKPSRRARGLDPNILNTRTMLIELGYSQRFEGHGGLDERADLFLGSFPELQYVLCVKIEVANRRFYYKIWQVGGGPPPLIEFTNAQGNDLLLRFPWCRLLYGNNDNPQFNPLPLNPAYSHELVIDLGPCREAALEEMDEMDV